MKLRPSHSNVSSSLLATDANWLYSPGAGDSDDSTKAELEVHTSNTSRDHYASYDEENTY